MYERSQKVLGIFAVNEKIRPPQYTHNQRKTWWNRRKII